MSEWLFGPSSMMWKINRESVLLIGGPATLLMQLAHPLVARGVADHSDFQSDPLGRLRRTIDTMLSITFGDTRTAAETMRRVDATHSSVRGTSEGRPYSARDPYLAKWVYATLVTSSVNVYEACVGPLEDVEKERYFEESKVVAGMFGIPDDMLPATRDDLMEWMREMVASGEVAVTPLARELAAPILRPIPIVPKRIADASSFVTAALLPRRIREGYGLRLGRSRSALLAVGRRASRLMLPLIPAPVRMLPAAREALARAG